MRPYSEKLDAYDIHRYLYFAEITTQYKHSLTGKLILIFMREYSVQFYKIYFSETGYDPCEWGAKLEDRYYNNRAFNVSLTILWPFSLLECVWIQAKLVKPWQIKDEG